MTIAVRIPSLVKLYATVLICLLLIMLVSLHAFAEQTPVTLTLPHYGQRWESARELGWPLPGDCGICAASMVEAYVKDYPGDDDILYAQVLAAASRKTSPILNYDIVFGLNGHGYRSQFVHGNDHLTQLLPEIYASLLDGKPVMIHYINPRNEFEMHWGVIAGCIGKADPFTLADFIVYSPLYDETRENEIGAVAVKKLNEFLENEKYRCNNLLWYDGGIPGIQVRDALLASTKATVLSPVETMIYAEIPRAGIEEQVGIFLGTSKEAMYPHQLSAENCKSSKNKTEITWKTVNARFALTPDTTYHYQFYIGRQDRVAGVWTGYVETSEKSAIYSFKTPPATITTGKAEQSGSASARFSGSFVLGGGILPDTASIILWQDEQDPIDLSVATGRCLYISPGKTTMDFELDTIDSDIVLKPGAQYYYQAYLQFGSQQYYGEIRDFVFRQTASAYEKHPSFETMAPSVQTETPKVFTSVPSPKSTSEPKSFPQLTNVGESAQSVAVGIFQSRYNNEGISRFIENTQYADEFQSLFAYYYDQSAVNGSMALCPEWLVWGMTLEHTQQFFQIQKAYAYKTVSNYSTSSGVSIVAAKVELSEWGAEQEEQKRECIEKAFAAYGITVEGYTTVSMLAKNAQGESVGFPDATMIQLGGRWYMFADVLDDRYRGTEEEILVFNDRLPSIEPKDSYQKALQAYFDAIKNKDIKSVIGSSVLSPSLNGIKQKNRDGAVPVLRIDETLYDQIFMPNEGSVNTAIADLFPHRFLLNHSLGVVVETREDVDQGTKQMVGAVFAESLESVKSVRYRLSYETQTYEIPVCVIEGNYYVVDVSLITQLVN